jgi:hypothetical protein
MCYLTATILQYIVLIKPARISLSRLTDEYRIVANKITSKLTYKFRCYTGFVIGDIFDDLENILFGFPRKRI